MKSTRGGWIKCVVICVLSIISIFLLFFWNAKDGFHVPSFIGHAVVGTSLTITSELQNITCAIPLASGGNLIGITCRNTSNTSIANRMATLGSLFLSIHAYNASNAADPWQAYAPNLPSYVVADLVDHDEKRGYWLFVVNASTLNITGVREIPTFISFTSGLLLFGYPSNTSANISIPFELAEGKYNRIFAYNTTVGGWQVFIPNGSSNLTHLSPERGYFLNATDSGFISVT